MDITVEHDALGTHFDWQLDGVTPRMIDWFWSNMEKGFVLWHPEQHESLEWPVPPRHGDPLGAIHNAPQTWDDGVRQDLYIRFARLEDVDPEIRDVITHDHVMIVAGLGLSREELERDDPLGYRVHQWSASDTGVVGRSSGIGRRKPEDEAAGKVWAAHAAEEIANWEVFLPTLYRLWRVVGEGSAEPVRRPQRRGSRARGVVPVRPAGLVISPGCRRTTPARACARRPRRRAPARDPRPSSTVRHPAGAPPP